MDNEPTFEELQSMKGRVLVEFGAEWCPICQAFAPQLSQTLKRYPEVKFIHVEDGKGRRLGRQFKVKLWPNLVFLRDGVLVAQLARPHVTELEKVLETF